MADARRALRALARVAALLLVTATASCAAGGAGATAATHGGTLRIGVPAAPNTLDPLFATSTTEGFLTLLIFDGLVYPLPDGTIEPALARPVPTLANGGISRDGRTITFHLRHGVRWQDGAPFTSADVAFTQAATLNPANNVVVRTPADRVARLDTPDPFTVVVHLRTPYGPFIAEWLPSIVPAHLLAGKHDLNDDAFNGAPIGTGAFRLTRWMRGERLELDANRGYFDGAPKLARIVIVNPGDDNAEVLALRTRGIDWLYQPSAAQATDLAGDPALRTERFDVNEQDDVYLNVTRPPLTDLRVRRALALAIDRATLAEKLGHGFLVPATADIPPFMWAYDPHLRAPYDPARARALLDAAGWKIGADGIRTRHGKRLSLTYLYAAGRPLETSYAIQLADELRAVGVELALKSLTASTYYAVDGPGYAGDFDLAYAPFYSPPDPDDTQVLSCSNVAPHGNNWSRWCDRDFEHWNDVAREHYDHATRRAAYAHTQQLVVDQVPVIITAYRVDAETYDARLHGIRDHDTYGRPYLWSW